MVSLVILTHNRKFDTVKQLFTVNKRQDDSGNSRPDPTSYKY